MHTFIGAGRWATFRNRTDFFSPLLDLRINIGKHMATLIIVFYCCLEFESTQNLENIPKLK